MAISAKLVNFLSSIGVIRKVPGDKFWTPIEIGLDNSYPTGGYTLATLAALCGFNAIEYFIPYVIGPTPAAGFADFAWDQANQKLKLMASTGAETTNATDVSSLKVYALILGS